VAAKASNDLPAVGDLGGDSSATLRVQRCLVRSFQTCAESDGSVTPHGAPGNMDDRGRGFVTGGNVCDIVDVAGAEGLVDATAVERGRQGRTGADELKVLASKALARPKSAITAGDIGDAGAALAMAPRRRLAVPFRLSLASGVGAARGKVLSPKPGVERTCRV